MSIYKGSARFRFYFDGRSHTLVCHRCIAQVAVPSSRNGHRGCWSAIGVFTGADGSALPIRAFPSAFQTAFVEQGALEGIFCVDVDTVGTALSGVVTVAHFLPIDAAVHNEVNEPEGLRLVLTGRDTPRVAQKKAEAVKPKAIN